MAALTRHRPGRIGAAGRAALFGLLFEAAAINGSPPAPYRPPANPPQQTGRPAGESPLRSYPPGWYYDPYTQGIAGLPQKGGD
jgi:hypothetical protein